MTTAEKELWQKINFFEIDHPDAAFPFSARLCRENNWELAFALRAIHEYKKFMFLLCATGRPLSPSGIVDQVWHLHLIYTKSYWEDFCKQVVNKPIHHTPTQGGAAESQKFGNWYAQTLQAYKVYFDTEPPADIWPATNDDHTKKNGIVTKLKRYWGWKF